MGTYTYCEALIKCMAQEDALPTIDEVHAIHRHIVEKYDLVDGAAVTDINDRIDQILSEVKSEDGEDEYDDAARLLSRFLSRSPYKEGNLATAWIITTIYLSRVGSSIKPKVMEMSPYVIRNAPRYPRAELAEWLRTGDIDKGPFEDSFEQEVNTA